MNCSKIPQKTTTMRNTIKTALKDNNFVFQTLKEDSEQLILKFGINLENGRCNTYIDLQVEAERVLIFTVLPVSVPQNKRSRMAEFITHANYGLISGNFEMCMTDGEIRYKNVYIFDNTFPNSTDVFIRNMYVTFHMVDRYLPGIMSVIYANVDPAVAIHQIESVVDPSFN